MFAYRVVNIICYKSNCLLTNLTQTPQSTLSASVFERFDYNHTKSLHLLSKLRHIYEEYDRTRPLGHDWLFKSESIAQDRRSRVHIPGLEYQSQKKEIRPKQNHTTPPLFRSWVHLKTTPLIIDMRLSPTPWDAALER